MKLTFEYGYAYKHRAEDLSRLGLEISKCKNLSSLCLKFCKDIIEVGGILKLIQALEKCSSLTSLNLDFTNVYLGAKGATELGLAISKCTNLTSLTLTFFKGSYKERDVNTPNVL